MSQRAPGGPSRSRRAQGGVKPISVILLVLAMIALFAAGFGLSRLISGRTSSASASTPAPKPCVTVTVTPGASLPKPKAVTVNVYNSTDTAGLAKKTAAELKDRGFTIGTVDNDPLGNVVKGVAEIRYSAASRAQAQLLEIYLPGAKLVKSDTAGEGIDLAIGPKFGAVLSNAQVEGALTSPSPSPSGPGCASNAPAPSTPAS